MISCAEAVGRGGFGTNVVARAVGSDESIRSALERVELATGAVHTGMNMLTVLTYTGDISRVTRSAALGVGQVHEAILFEIR